jgi:hypothetical protein
MFVPNMHIKNTEKKTDKEQCLAALNKSIAEKPSRKQPVRRNSQITSSSDELKVIILKTAGRSTPKGEVKAWTLSPGVYTSPLPVARFLLQR